MANKTNAQVSGEINTLYTFPEEESISLTTETLSIVGTAEKGPAFVPQQFVSFNSSANILNTWENVFGSFSSQNKKSGPKIKIYVKNPIESEVKFRSNLFLVTLLILLLLFKDEKYS